MTTWDGKDNRPYDPDKVPEGLDPEQWRRNQENYRHYYEDYSEDEYLKTYNKAMVDFTDQVNYDLINKKFDAPMVEFIVDTIRAFEIVRFIKFTGYEYTEKESEVDEDRYIKHRGKGYKKSVIVNGKKKNIYCHDYKEIDDSRCGLLTMHFEITMEVIERKDKETKGELVMKKRNVTINILVPLEDMEGFYQLKGNKKYLIYQLTENSTYTTRNAVTLKSVMPVYTKRVSITEEDVDGVEYKMPVYYINVFNEDHPVLLFFLANGFYAGLQKLTVADIIFLKPKSEITERDKEIHIIFKIGADVFLLVNKTLFDKYTYVRSVIGGILSTITKRNMTIDAIEDAVTYVTKIGNKNEAKGENTLLYFHRLLDKGTAKILKIDDMFKFNIYDVLAYLMQNFNELRKKDNLSLKNKRLRRREVVAAMVTQDISKRISNIIKKGAKVELDDILNAMKIPANLLIQKMNKSNLLRFDDNINDNLSIIKLTYTIKGPNSVGGKNSNKISKDIRGIHPSYLGHIDILHCGNSDPGTSGVLNPFTDIKSMYFDEEPEPDDFLFEFMDDLDKVLSTEYDDYTLIRFPYDSKEEFYRIQREIRENEDNIFESWIAPGTDILDKKDVNLSTDNYAETASKTGTTDENNKDEYDVGEDI
nr:MAG TPA: hypothetical protein [Caudoviricetes sp.]